MKFYGRLLERREIEVRDYEFDAFHDSSSISFVHPVGIATDPLIFQILLHFHWDIFSHKGTGSTNRVIAQVLYIVKQGYVVKAIRDGCQKCKIILKKHIQDKMGDIRPSALFKSIRQGRSQHIAAITKFISGSKLLSLSLIHI